MRNKFPRKIRLAPSPLSRLRERPALVCPAESKMDNQIQLDAYVCNVRMRERTPLAVYAHICGRKRDGGREGRAGFKTALAIVRADLGLPPALIRLCSREYPQPRFGGGCRNLFIGASPAARKFGPSAGGTARERRKNACSIEQLSALEDASKVFENGQMYGSFLNHLFISE